MGAWAEAKAKHKNTTSSATIAMDSGAADEAERLEPVLRRLRNEDGEKADRSEQVRELAERIDALEQQARASELVFTFEGIGRGQYAKLLTDHPLPEELQEKLGDQIDYDPVVFPPLLMALSCVDPPELHAAIMPDGEADSAVVAEWVDIYTTWSNGQVSRLWRACIGANAGVNEAPKSLLVSAILAPETSATS